MRDGGKGDTPRPLGVPMEVFDRNFEAIFGKKKQEDKCPTHERDDDADSREQSSSVQN